MNERHPNKDETIYKKKKLLNDKLQYMKLPMTQG
jgi:hypothetical protein